MTTRCHDQFMPDKGNFAAVVTPILYQSEVGTLNTCDARQVSSQMAGESKYIVEQRVYRKSRRAQSATDCETWVPDDSSNTLNSFDVGDTRATSLAVSSLGVRRLTPTECERLQGFPDGWTDGQVDSHRYRQLGNAVTVNVAEWLCRRAAAVLRGTSP
jgi:site-specific DNA-cytosine methylase